VVKDDSDRLSVLRQELRRRLGCQRYELWLGPPTQLAWHEGVLRVRCPSQAEAQWLKRNLIGALNECLAAAFDSSPPIVFDSAEGTQNAVPSARQTTLFEEAADGVPAEAPKAAPSRHDAASAGDQRAKGPRWTFEDFVVGAANRLAVQAAREVAQQPGRFSPLLIYGPAGVGKSHLLSAAAHYARIGGRRLRVMPLTAEQFTSQFLEALDRRALPGFRQKMRNLDVLLIDDVQFFAGKKATLEELLYTIDALHARGAQVALSSDRAAKDLAGLSAELFSRISAGLAVALDPPDYETRVGIVRSMAERMRIPMDNGVVELVARQVVGSGRLLSGAINRLVAASMACSNPITVDLAEPALVDFCRQHSPQVRLLDIQRAVCEVFGVESSSLKSPRKTRAVAEPRMLAMWLARRYTRAALSEIGDFFGRRSHSTVVSAQRKFDNLISRHGEIIIGDQPCQVEEAIRRVEAKLRTA
jgi:chromosomal replication initiator protein